MVGLAVAAFSIGQLVTVTEPRTTAAICAQVAYVGDGAGGIPTVWAVQRGGSRTLKLPLAEIKPGCEEGTRPSPGTLAGESRVPLTNPSRPDRSLPPTRPSMPPVVPVGVPPRQ